MNLTRDRVYSLGWAFVLSVCFALTMALVFRVNAVKSEVQLAERRIVALKQEKLFLETEFQARSNQQQLKELNDVEFGYEAPKAEQYIEGERQLATLGKPRAPGAPKPIRVASVAADGDRMSFPSLVSPLTGKSLAVEAADAAARERAGTAGLDRRLVHIAIGEAGRE